MGAPLSADEVALVHTAPPPPVAPAPPPAPSRRTAPIVEPVPRELRDAVQRRTGVDVGDVLVHRDERAARESRELAARAFTRDREVSLPQDAGSLDDRRVRGLLAHELTHVAQQQQYGGALPLEHTPLGRRLEAQARKVEREVSGVPEPQPVRVEAPPPPPAQDGGPTDFVITQQADAFRRAAAQLMALGATIDADGALTFDPEHALENLDLAHVFSTAPGVQRAPWDSLVGDAGSSASSFVPGAEQALGGFAQRGISAAEQEVAGAIPAAEGAVQNLGGMAQNAALSEFQPAAQAVEQEASSLLGTVPAPSAAPAEPARSPAAAGGGEPAASAGPSETGFDGYDPEIMFRQLYRRVHQQLRRDMLLERERSGSLANSH